MSKRNTMILGAAGRDFHNFNTFFKRNENYNVVAFTATQIPEIDGRRYPSELAGENYPHGIPIYPEEDLHILIKRFDVQDCVFSYTDVSYEKVMSTASIVQAAGANFMLLGPGETMIRSSKPVISVCAVRTGCGKSQTSRRIIELLLQKGKKVIAIRHPMPYGNLLNQKVSLTKLRGNVFEIQGIKTMVTYHPAALLRNPNWKKGCWEDVQKFRKLYDSLTK